MDPSSSLYMGRHSLSEALMILFAEIISKSHCLMRDKMKQYFANLFNGVCNV